MEAIQLFAEIQALAERVAVLEERMAINGRLLEPVLPQTPEAARFMAAIEDVLVPACYEELLTRAVRLAVTNGGMVTLNVVHAAIAQTMEGE